VDAFFVETDRPNYQYPRIFAHNFIDIHPRLKPRGEHVDAAEFALDENGLRKTLDYETPAERFSQCVAMTD